MACKITYKGIRYNSLEELYADAYNKSKSLGSAEQDLSQQQVKPGVKELFESNPELANAVYEAVGLKTLENSRLEKDIKELIKDREDIPSSIFLSYLVDNNLIPKIQEYITSIGYRGGEWNELYGRLTLNYSISNTKSEIAKLMSHELMHALSLKYITSYEALRQPDFKEYIDKVNENEKIKGTNRKIELINLTREQVDAFDNLVRIKEKVFDFIKAGKFNKNEKLTNANFGSLNYAFSELDKKEDIHEFISEAFSNPILIDVLKQIPTEGNKSNLFKEFIKALKIILGFNDESIIEDILYYSEKAFINEALKESNTKKQQAQQLYSQYLDTIFPDSKVKDIVYHGSPESFEQFDKSKLGSYTGAKSAKEGIFFGSSKDVSKSYLDKRGKTLNLNKFIENKYGKEVSDKIGQGFNYVASGLAEKVLGYKPERVAPTNEYDDTYGIKLKDGSILYDNGNYSGINKDAKFLQAFIKRQEELESTYDINYGGYIDKDRDITDNPFEDLFIRPFILSISNPLITSDEGKTYREESYYERIKTAKNQNKDGVIIKDTYDSKFQTKPETVYAVFEPEQIHRLGSKQDIEGFKEFVSQPTSKPTAINPEQFPSALQEAIDAMIMLDPTRDIQSIIDELTMDGTINQECN